MDKFLEENSFSSIHFLHNNSYFVENKIIAGTRGWSFDFDEADFEKIYNRESIRLELSIKEGIQRFGHDKDIICFMHYPPITKNMMEKGIQSKYLEVLKKYNVHKLYYGHLHGHSFTEVVEGNVDGVDVPVMQE